MQKIIDVNFGVYLLELKLEDNFLFSTGKFSGLKIPKGFYYYAGSAQKNLKQRVRRHLRKNKTIYWHIDHLTCGMKTKITSIYLLPGNDKSVECEIVRFLRDELLLTFPLAGFGNSDCRNCKSHLLFSKTKIDYNHFISRYQSTVRFIPSSNETF
ncbi:MAG: GIY-YIG nuclease family protein [Melioribacteraceae bacterium]|nr:GIY-YIG nuclease family protein [Melioribacteraceae bacterium]MCF8353409.1 GIY-YIG nuclease family protein [Melioribacteraceae bacterium]MCF8396376.1 GIY-YIG nuclease family protein [Melioribacteraceae bacterium]MCF8418970.1 GIY-YIG nuclease family protein [Melioribacteraceae bacterium]